MQCRCDMGIEDAAASGENRPASKANSSVLAITRCIGPSAESRVVSAPLKLPISPRSEPAQDSACRKHRAVSGVGQSPEWGRQKNDIGGRGGRGEVCLMESLIRPRASGCARVEG
jgi:hypothetical protein